MLLKCAYSLLHIKNNFDTLFKSKCFITLDLAIWYQKKGFVKHQEKWAFSTTFVLFQYIVMSFKLATAPTTFIRLMTIVFSSILYSTCLPYLDNTIIFNFTFKVNLDRLTQAPKLIKIANFYLKAIKCAFCKNQS